MKVLQINVLSDSRSTGRTTNELHRYLLEHGHESFVAYGIGNSVKDNRFYKITNPIDYYFHNICARLFGTQGFHSKVVTKKLVKWIEQLKPDVVHLRNLHSNFINLDILFSYLSKKKIPVVITTHDFWFLTAFCPYPLIGCNILDCGNCKRYHKKPTIFYDPNKIFLKKKQLLQSLDNVGIQANSNFSLSIVKQSFLSNAISETIYNWIDFKTFFPEPDKSVFGALTKPVVLVVWSFLDEKSERFLFFKKIAQILQQKYDFVMVGNYDFDICKYPFIKFFKGTNDLNVLRKYYSSADVFFNPSTTDTFGKVAAESISCGTPCVVFKNQALPEIVGDNECGVVVKPFDEEETISAIDLVIKKGKSHYYDMCLTRSRSLFDKEINCGKLVKFYERLLNNEH